MPIREVEEFLDEVCLEVKYRFARKKIRQELMDHLEDHANRLIDKGYESEEAYKRAVKAMGSSLEVGKALNKEHNPLLGWIVTITNVVVFIGVFYFGYLMFSLSLMSLLNIYEFNHSVDQEDIMFEYELDGEFVMDNRKIELVKIIGKKNHEVIISYKSKNINPFIHSLGFYPFDYYYDTDDFAIYGGASSSYFFGSSLHTASIEHVPYDVKHIIMEYDKYNRYVKFDIDLQALAEEGHDVKNK